MVRFSLALNSSQWVRTGQGWLLCSRPGWSNFRGCSTSGSGQKSCHGACTTLKVGKTAREGCTTHEGCTVAPMRAASLSHMVVGRECVYRTVVVVAERRTAHRWRQKLACGALVRGWLWVIITAPTLVFAQHEGCICFVVTVYCIYQLSTSFQIDCCLLCWRTHQKVGFSRTRGA